MQQLAPPSRYGLFASALATISAGALLLPAGLAWQDDADGEQTESESDPYRPSQTEFPIEYTFESAPFGARGYRALEELQGAPVFALYFVAAAADTDEQLSFAMQQLERHGSNLNVVLCEQSDHDWDAIERMIWDSGWGLSNAIWTTEQPIPRNDWRPMMGFLLSHEGKAIWWGDPLVDAERTATLIDEAVETALLPPEANNKKLRDVWEVFNKGKWELAHKKAIALRDKAADKYAGTSSQVELELMSQAGFVALEIEMRSEFMAERGEAAIALGEPLVAAELLDLLEERRVKKSRRCEAARERLAAALDDRKVKAELAAAKKGAELFQRANDEGVNGQRAELEAFAERHDGTHAAKRARRLLDLFGA